MPQGNKLLFKVNLIRRSRKTGEVISRKQVHTQAVSKGQAEKFVTFKNPGFKITRITEV